MLQSVIFRAVPLAALMIAFSMDVAAQRNSSIGTKVDFFSGLSNFSSVSGTDIQDLNWKKSVLFYAAYPTVQFRSQGEHSYLQTDYTFGMNRMKSGGDLNWESQTASAKFSTDLRRWRVNFSESFDLTPDFTALNVSQASAPTADGFRFLYAPIARHSVLTNTASGSAEYVVTEKSAVSFNVSHSLRDYDDSLLIYGSLSDQYRALAEVSYSRRTSERSSLRVGYAATFYGFEEFDGARSHAVNATYSHSFSPTLILRVTGGPSYVQTHGSGRAYLGYNTSASLQKRVRSNTFWLQYSRSNGESSGYGSVSGVWQAAVGMTRRVGKRTTASANLSVFDSHAKAGDSYRMRGASAGASIGLTLDKSVSLNWGGDYQRYDQTALFGFAQTRVFFYLRFNSPAWRLSR